MNIDENAIRKQSENAYNQWAVQWREQAKQHSKYPMKSMQDFENIGIGKACLVVANGYSFEKNLETIKAKQGNVDILCCDKSLGHLLNNGIKPTYCMVCDANVNYEKYLKPWEDQLQDTILFINVCGNPTWTEKGNWKDRYFFVNMDILNSEQEFMALSGCRNTIAAGTNVSNAMVILLTQCTNESGRRNYFGYDKILLIGFDYCWTPEGSYYAFDRDGGGKANYMKHVYGKTAAGGYCFTSNNLAFSAGWINKYIQVYKLPVVQCSNESILMTPMRGVLSEQMDYSFKRDDATTVRGMVKMLREILQQSAAIKERLGAISQEHQRALLHSVNVGG